MHKRKLCLHTSSGLILDWDFVISTLFLFTTTSVGKSSSVNTYKMIQISKYFWQIRLLTCFPTKYCFKELQKSAPCRSVIIGTVETITSVSNGLCSVTGSTVGCSIDPSGVRASSSVVFSSSGCKLTTSDGNGIDSCIDISS